MIASTGGKRLKGSSYTFRSLLHKLEKDPSFFTPSNQAKLTREEFLEVFRSDDGKDPMPAFNLHLEIARRFGQDMIALEFNAQKIVACAKNSPAPLKTLYSIMDHISGFKEDPLRKKTSLLALTLIQRPEKFLTLGKEEQIPPVIDYHLMRSCLRTGIIEVKDKDLEKILTHRKIISPQDEWAIRYASYKVIEEVAAKSGKGIDTVDYFFFNARKRCPEMSEPVCAECPMDPACAHRKELFQPVIRTTFY